MCWYVICGFFYTSTVCRLLWKKVNNYHSCTSDCFLFSQFKIRYCTVVLKFGYNDNLTYNPIVDCMSMSCEIYFVLLWVITLQLLDYKNLRTALSFYYIIIN